MYGQDYKSKWESLFESEKYRNQTRGDSVSNRRLYVTISFETDQMGELLKVQLSDGNKILPESEKKGLLELAHRLFVEDLGHL